MRDDAVSAVVAAMLLLAILVTFFSVWNTVMLPALKGQAEVGHIEGVEESFLKFGSDLETAAALKSPLRLSRRITLGGGDIIFNSVKSGGTLFVQQEDGQVIHLICGERDYTSTLINYSYTPVSNFWQDQGYVWQYGYVNVTKGSVSVPLDFFTMDDLLTDASTSGFAAALIDLDDRGCYQYTLNESVWSVGPPGHPSQGSIVYPENTFYNCTGIVISLVTFTPGGQNIASGNGIARLTLNTVVEEQVAGQGGSVAVRVSNNLPLPLNNMLWEKCNTTFERINNTYDNICGYNPTHHDGYDEVAVMINDESTEIVVRTINITVSV